jgi:hypothetical protein
VFRSEQEPTWQVPLWTFVQDPHTDAPNFNCASSLKQQSEDRHVPHSDTLSCYRDKQYLLFLINADCLARSNTKNINFIVFWFDPNCAPNTRCTALEASTLTITPLMQISGFSELAQLKSN